MKFSTSNYILGLFAGVITLTASVFSIWFNDFFTSLFWNIPIHLYICLIFASIKLIMNVITSAKNYSIAQVLFNAENYPSTEDSESNYNHFSFEFFFNRILKPFLIFIGEVAVFGGIGIILCIFVLTIPWYFGFLFFCLIHGGLMIIFNLINLISTSINNSKAIDF